MVKQRQAATALRFEALEQKRLMAGNVTIGASDGNWFLLGDKADNQMAMTAANEAGAIAVIGLYDTTLSLNGHSFAPGEPAVIPAIGGDVLAYLDEGNDVVVIDNVAFSGNVAIAAGGGDDTVVVGTTTDSVDQAARQFPRVAVGGQLVVHGGAGNDAILANHLVVGQGLTLAAGKGDDTVALTSSRIHGHAAIAGGVGRDHILVAGTVAGHSLWVDGGRGGGSDNVAMNRVRTPLAWVATGGGDDAVGITDSAFGHLGVQLGSGNDGLAVGGVTVPGGTILDGGLGNDWLHEIASNQIAHARVVNFV